MKNPGIFWLSGLVFLLCISIRMKAQSDQIILGKIEHRLQDYQDFSALGRSGSAFIDQATITSFKNLFEMDANLFWDLYKTDKQRVSYLLTVDEYTDSIQRVYDGRKPVISFGKHRIEVNRNGKTAIVYMHKTNYLSETRESGSFKLNREGLNLRFLLNLNRDTVLIQNITEDTRLTRVRGMSIEGGVNLIGKISSGFLSDPVSETSPNTVYSYKIESLSGYHAGLDLDLRISRKTLDGLLINIGLVYSVTTISVSVENYVYTCRQPFDLTSNPFEVSVFDRSPVVSEKITLQGFSVPVTAKWYPARWLYLKAGPQFSLISGNSHVDYILSHTGGGKGILLNESTLPENEKKWFYLDESHEMDDAQYGFFRNREFHPAISINMATVQISAVFGLGVEAKFSRVVVGFEPWLTLGISNLMRQTDVQDYRLFPEDVAESFMQSCVKAKLNSFGIKLTIGKMFYR